MKEQNAKEELHLLLCQSHELTQRNTGSYELHNRIKELRIFLDSLNDDDKDDDKKEVKSESEGPF